MQTATQKTGAVTQKYLLKLTQEHAEKTKLKPDSAQPTGV